MNSNTIDPATEAPLAPLATRISAALSGGTKLTSAELSALLAEAERAVPALRRAAADADLLAVDPAQTEAAALAAATSATAANFALRRGEQAVVKLAQAVETATHDESEAVKMKRYRAAVVRRDKVAARIRDELPKLAQAMADLIVASVEGGEEIDAINRDLPAGVPRLDRPEGHARGFTDSYLDGHGRANFNHGIVSLASAVIPDPDNLGRALWPEVHADRVIGFHHLIPATIISQRRDRLAGIV